MLRFKNGYSLCISKKTSLNFFILSPWRGFAVVFRLS